MLRSMRVRLCSPCLREHVDSLLERDGSMGLPSVATVSRARVILDASLILMERSQHLPCIRFGIADSSPQKGHDWLLSATDEVAAKDVIPAWRAVCEMIKDLVVY